MQNKEWTVAFTAMSFNLGCAGGQKTPDEMLLVEVFKLSLVIFACLQLTTMGVFFSSIMRFDVHNPIHNISCMVNSGGGGGMESGGCGRRCTTFTRLQAQTGCQWAGSLHLII